MESVVVYFLCSLTASWLVWCPHLLLLLAPHEFLSAALKVPAGHRLRHIGVFESSSCWSSIVVNYNETGSTTLQSSSPENESFVYTSYFCAAMVVFFPLNRFFSAMFYHILQKFFAWSLDLARSAPAGPLWLGMDGWRLAILFSVGFIHVVALRLERFLQLFFCVREGCSHHRLLNTLPR